MAHGRAAGPVVVDMSRRKQEFDGFVIADINLFQVVSAEDGRDGKKDEKNERADAELPISLEKQKRSEDGQQAVFRHGEKCEEKRPQDTGWRSPEHPIQAECQNDRDLPETHGVHDVVGGQEDKTAKRTDKLFPARHQKIVPFETAGFDQRQTGQIDDDQNIEYDPGDLKRLAP